MKKIQKPKVFCIFWDKYTTNRQKRSHEVLNTYYTAYVRIWVYFIIKPGRKYNVRFCLGPLVSLVWRNVCIHKSYGIFFLKLKASSTKWRIWMISLKPCLANVSSGICQIRNHHTLNQTIKNLIIFMFSLEKIA